MDRITKEDDVFKTLKHFLFDYQYFSRSDYATRVNELAIEAGARTCRGNVSLQAKRFATAQDIENEARASII